MQSSRRAPSTITALLILSVVSVVAFLLGANFASYPSNSSLSRGPKLPSSSSSSSSGVACPLFRPHQQRPCPGTKKTSNDDAADDNANTNDEDASSTSTASTSFRLPSAASIKQCVDRAMTSAEKYVQFAEQAATIRKERGPLKIAGFSRLWVPPLHGTGGMQFHAMHLYSQLAVKGHTVHVFVTGPPQRSSREVYYAIDEATHAAVITHNKGRARLVVHQVASSDDGEYSPVWYANCLTALAAVNKTLGGDGFDVVHSESWAAVANIYPIGLPAAVTWHGSMLDWFRNEINLIVHNFRMRGKMTGEHTANRMKELGNSVAYEAYALLSVPDHIVISDAAAYDLRHVNLLDHDSVHTIYNGVNTKNFKPAENRAQTRREFLTRVAKMTGDDEASLFLVGCGGRLDGIKGHHQLSVAMKSVLERNDKMMKSSTEKKKIVLLVAGRGHESHRYETLKSQGLRVVMLGMLNQNDLAAFYQSVDVFVDPFYQHHGLNTVQLEAALSGVPILVTDLASAQTTVPCNGGLGVTFPLGAPAALAERIEWFAAHPEERRAMGAAARRRASMLFSSSVMAARYEHLLYEAVANPRPLPQLLGKVVCRHTYPKMCFRTPTLEDDLPKNNPKKKH